MRQPDVVHLVVTSGYALTLSSWFLLLIGSYKIRHSIMVSEPHCIIPFFKELSLSLYNNTSYRKNTRHLNKATTRKRIIIKTKVLRNQLICLFLVCHKRLKDS